MPGHFVKVSSCREYKLKHGFYMLFEELSLRKHEDTLFYILFAFEDTPRKFFPSSHDYGYDSLPTFDNTRMSFLTWIRRSTNSVNQNFFQVFFPLPCSDATVSSVYALFVLTCCFSYFSLYVLGSKGTINLMKK